jgi:hypothetical protein
MRSSGLPALAVQLATKLLTLLVNVILAHPVRINDRPANIKTGYGEDLRRTYSSW